MQKKEFKGGIWSAAPTPFIESGEVDVESIQRLTDHHLRLGIKGVFLCGTSGEGAWMTDKMCKEVVDATVKASNGRLKTTVQVTDNSSIKILDNIAKFVDSGVDAVIMAPPFFSINGKQDYLKNMFIEVLDKSPLPVGFYHRGKNASVSVEPSTVMEIMSHPNLIMIKDSSGDKDVMKAFANCANNLENTPLLFNGDEFDSVPYLKAGYDGCLFGGGCFNGFISNLILDAATIGEFDAAQNLQDKMNSIMNDCFGGEGFPCWLAGQKQVLVELGIFKTNKTIINYSLTEKCHEAIKAIIIKQKEFLLP